MPDPDHQPSDPAPESGTYCLHNVFGTPLHRRHVAAEGDPLPAAPRGHTWRLEHAAVHAAPAIPGT